LLLLRHRSGDCACAKDLDVTLVRILSLFITFATGVCPGVVSYLLAWIMVPSEPELRPVLAAQQPVAS
jgi:hypothetical protein